MLNTKSKTQRSKSTYTLQKEEVKKLTFDPKSNTDRETKNPKRRPNMKKDTVKNVTMDQEYLKIKDFSFLDAKTDTEARSLFAKECEKCKVDPKNDRWNFSHFVKDIATRKSNYKSENKDLLERLYKMVAAYKGKALDKNKKKHHIVVFLEVGLEYLKKQAKPAKAKAPKAKAPKAAPETKAPETETPEAVNQ